MPLLNIGSKAPDFTLPDQSGTTHRLADHAGKPVVLYFYPKDDTEDCTIEACSFRDALPAFHKLKAAVLGISPDDVKRHAKFATKHALNFPILADPKPESKVCRAYGTFVEKTMYGKPVTTVARTTYLIDAKGIIRARWDKKQIEADVGGHPSEVQTAIRLLDAAQDPLQPPQTQPKLISPRTQATVKKAAAKKATKGNTK